MYLFKDLKFEKHPIAEVFKNAVIAKMTFSNGYGISVIHGAEVFSCGELDYEVGVLKNGHLYYSTPITGDVLGYQTEEDINKIMKTLQSYEKDQY